MTDLTLALWTFDMSCFAVDSVLAADRGQKMKQWHSAQTLELTILRCGEVVNVTEADLHASLHGLFHE